MDQILCRRFRCLWVDRDEQSDRQRRKEEEEEEEEDLNAALEKYVYAIEEEEEDLNATLEKCVYAIEGEEEDLNAALEKYVYAIEEEEEDLNATLEKCVYAIEGEEEDLSAALEKYVYAIEEDEEAFINAATENYVYAIEEEEDVYAAMEKYVYSIGEEEEKEDANAATEKYVYAMGEEEEEEDVNAAMVKYLYAVGEEEEDSNGLFISEKFRIQVAGVKWIKHYSSDHKILLVGEGDFSFSASLAAAFGSATNITATSLDSFEFLVRNYRNACPNIIALQNYGANVLHEVDATEMANLSLLKHMRFDRVVYNFPLAGFFPNQSREVTIRLNQNLVELFLENAKKMIDISGEIHITHKCYGFFLEWDLEALALGVGLRLEEEVRFNLRDYPGYNTKYGFGGDKNFNCNPSKTYKFVHQNQVQFWW